MPIKAATKHVSVLLAEFEGSAAEIEISSHCSDNRYTTSSFGKNFPPWI